jgi:hypothetical protein
MSINYNELLVDLNDVGLWSTTPVTDWLKAKKFLLIQVSSGR